MRRRVSNISAFTEGSGSPSRSLGVRLGGGAKGQSEGRGREAPGKEPGRRGRISSSPTPAGAWDRGPRREADRRQMAHAGGGGRLASAPGCPRRGLLLLGGGGGEQPPARPPRLSGGLETADHAQPRSRREGGGQKELGGEGVCGGRGGVTRGGQARSAAPFHPRGAVEGPEAGGGGNRMKDKRQPIPNQSTRAGGTGERRIKVFWTPPCTWQAHTFPSLCSALHPSTGRPGCPRPAQWQSG